MKVNPVVPDLQVYKAGLYGRRYVWFLIGWYSDSWFVPVEGEGLNCTAEQMAEAVAFHITTEAVMLFEAPIPGVSGKTGPEFQEQLRGRLAQASNVTGGWVEAPLAYDALWVVARALDCARRKLARRGQRLEDFSYQVPSNLSQDSG